VKVLPDFTPYAGAAEAAARAKYDEMRELIHPRVELAMLYSYLGDLSDYPIDGPVPEAKEGVPIRGLGAGLARMPRRESNSRSV
jgi:hypothetical protein